MTRATGEFATLLGDFSDGIDRLWEQYDACGPGEVDSGLLEPIETLAGQLTGLLAGPLPAAVDRAALASAISQATDLARRCATLPQGLCFVSGEAGLVPRTDQINAFATARAMVRAEVVRLSRDDS